MINIVLGIIVALIGVIWNDIRGRVNKSDERISKHDERLLILERDKHYEIKALEKKIEDMSKQLEELKKYVHESIHKSNSEKQMISNLVMGVNELLKKHHEV